MTGEINRINKLIQTYKFASLMEACIQIFQLIDENMTLTPDAPYLERKVAPVCHYAVLEIDHMHEERRYLKHVQDFSKQTSVHALLLLARKTIFILLAVECDAVERFLFLMRTVNVDVDRRRRPCRERMMKVLEQDRAVGVHIPQSILGTSVVHRNVCKKGLSTVLSSFNLPPRILDII